MNCPSCNAEPVEVDVGGTLFACGSILFGNGVLGESSKCNDRKLHLLRTFKAAVIAADRLATTSATADAIRELCKGESR